MARIVLNDAHLTFRLRKRGSTSIKDFALRPLLRLVGALKPAPPPTVVHALRGVSLDLKKGDRLGIVGHNGAGKSSLLRLLAGVYRPTQGERIVEGRISSLFELMLGFEEDATGWENIRYRGYLLKEPPARLEARVDEIAAFSELSRDALEMPIKYYSSGMLVRLAISVATAIQPEILLIDEVLAAGDLAFLEKTRRRMKEMMGQASVMVLVSHAMDSIEQLCNRAAWMEQGRVRMTGDPAEVVAAYKAHMLGEVRAAA
ncbi:MAG: ABC transporter ATP-binding protein [Gemmataceae bacterium]|nr:ABC transporter ATP-binding protein [Gemmataceae bacterium]